ncbi:phosphatidylinositol mannoside acyltransferase [Microlunatus sp. Gsoil 973]|uniref:phosphatidylinositol mannoside acyltransferase n=1 Tax=Microlunatus sp. Gsoil 973 TaxID=2672569 RepID=UPI0012B4A5B9|nr:phosphatidylinositol mannoside acyltransferase [Microlunatus sp. Gsoil 973]QGN32783.1 phosphatidylinositol mannoside acyltransferase [Microlunatus sp. Gsoil 973]
MAPAPDWSLGLLYQVGWRIGPRIPASVQRMISSAGAAIAVDRSGPHIRQYAQNLRYATDREPDRDLLRAGIASYLRNLLEVFALPGWSRSKIISRVTTTGEGELRRAMAGEGAVIALPHSGNWDLAGAWACVTGMPVSTVVEELDGPAFAAFRAFREGLGMQVIGHRDPAALPELMTAARGGRLVCLVADRDLLGSGVPVTWNGHPVTMPAGPAVVARRTGAALFPMVSWFTPEGLQLDIGPRIEHRPGRDGLIAMVQDEADFFAAGVAEHPQDWHLMQPFFVDRSQTPEGAA